MSEQGLKKAWRVCAALTACCALALLVYLVMVFNGDISWSSMTELVMKLLAAGVFLPPLAVVGLRHKFEEQKKEDRLKELEAEVKRLGRK